MQAIKSELFLALIKRVLKDSQSTFSSIPELIPLAYFSPAQAAAEKARQVKTWQFSLPIRVFPYSQWILGTPCLQIIFANISYSSLRRFVAAGYIPHVPCGSRLFVYYPNVTAFIKNGVTAEQSRDYQLARTRN